MKINSKYVLQFLSNSVFEAESDDDDLITSILVKIKERSKPELESPLLSEWGGGYFRYVLRYLPKVKKWGVYAVEYATRKPLWEPSDYIVFDTHDEAADFLDSILFTFDFTLKDASITKIIFT